MKLSIPTGLHFLEERPVGSPRSLPGSPDFALRPVPLGISYLRVPAPTRPTTPLRLRRSPPRLGAALAIEPVRVWKRQRLMLKSPPRAGVRINGLPAACVSLLLPGDQIELAPGALLHVVEYRRLVVEKPSAEVLGRRCLVCRLPCAKNTTVYVCSVCGEPRHLERSPVPADQRLECALLSNCPVCDSELPTEEGSLFPRPV